MIKHVLTGASVGCSPREASHSLYKVHRYEYGSAAAWFAKPGVAVLATEQQYTRSNKPSSRRGVKRSLAPTACKCVAGRR